MDKLFELSAELTLDAAGFLRSLAKAEQAARNAGRTMTQLQKTYVSAWRAVAGAIQAATEKMQAFLKLQGVAAPSTAPGFATGLDYVPYNNFPARLHEGEAVLTALEASQWRAGQTAAPAMDAAALGKAMADALSGAAVVMDGQLVGQLVTPTVSRELVRQTSLNKTL